MARLIALEWDDSEVRLVVATRRTSGLLVEHAWVVPLVAPEIAKAELHPAEQTGELNTDSRGMAIVKLPTPVEVGTAISEALKARGIARGECLVAIGRTNIELKHLQLPPAPDDELPEMVRFQALREFNKLQEDSPLDYIPLSGDDEEARYVLAAAMAPELVEDMFETCRTAGIQPKRFVLRPCAAASLLRRARPDEIQQVCLLVDLLADETDLTVQVDGVEVFMRTARVTGDSAVPGGWRSLLVEIRRTMAAVSNQLGGRRVEAIYLCGDGQRHVALAKQIEAELQLPAHLLDPFSVVELTPSLAAALPEHHGRYAPLLGMLADEAAGTSPSIDFLHPRQRPEPPSRKRLWVLGVGAAACLLLAVTYFGWAQRSAREDEIAQLKDQIKAIDTAVSRGKGTGDPKDAVEKKAKEIDLWANGDRVWIDELKQLSDKFVKPQDAMLSSLTAAVAQQNTEVTLEGFARNGSTINELATDLRDKGHKVETKDSREDPRQQQKGYPWRFSTKISVAKQVRPATPAAKTATTAVADASKSDKATVAEKTPAKDIAPVKDAKSADVKPADTKATDAKSTETKPATDKPAADKPADSRTPDAKSTVVPPIVKAPADDSKTVPADAKTAPASAKESAKPSTPGEGA